MSSYSDDDLELFINQAIKSPNSADIPTFIKMLCESKYGCAVVFSRNKLILARTFYLPPSFKKLNNNPVLRLA